jgi:hypothetical protein
MSELSRSTERWAACSPKAISEGSQAQVLYALQDAQHDIAFLADEIKAGNFGLSLANAEIERLNAVLEATQAAPKVNALVWNKSIMPSWNDDWHTTYPLQYTIRCADEYGWKWSLANGFGYASSAEQAKRDVQADFERRVLFSISAQSDEGEDR